MQSFVLSGPMGNLQTRETKTGDKMVTFGVCHKEKVKGEEKVEWFNCVTFGKRAELLERLGHAISKITLTGKVQQNTWESESGKQTNVQVLVNEFDLTFKPKTDTATANTASNSNNLVNSCGVLAIE